MIDDSSCQTFLMIHPILNFSNCSALIIRFGFLAGQTYTQEQIRTLQNHKSDCRMLDCPKIKIFQSRIEFLCGLLSHWRRLSLTQVGVVLDVS